MKTVLAFLILFSPMAYSAKVLKYQVIQGKEKTYHTGLVHKKNAHKGLGESHFRFSDCGEMPSEFDLRAFEVVPEVRDQGQCGSCWSFSQTASLESATLASGGAKLNLSEQELVSCDSSNYGCDGGNLNDFDYQIKHGQGLETDFKYTASDSRCKTITPAAKGVDYAYVGAANRYPTEDELKCALYKTHTIPWITVSASNAWSSPPDSETTVYNHCGRGTTNHAVGVVGWHTVNGKTAFIMRNSWGEDWGDKGYMSLPLKCDSFGEEVAYIMTEAMPCKAPIFKLPAFITADKGTEVMLGTKEQANTTYTWYVADTKVATGAVYFVTPTETTTYKLVAKNACGEAESSVQVTIQQ